MSKETIKKYLTPAVKKATDEELSIIGIASFGSNLGLIKTGLPHIYEEFCRLYNVTENKEFDRKMSHYMVTQVEPNQRTIKTSTGVKLDLDKKPSLNQIVQKAKQFKR